MSQKEVYEILKSLGGRATTREIRDEAHRRFPTLTLYSYVTNRLRRLEKKGIVRETAGMWKIVSKFYYLKKF